MLNAFFSMFTQIFNTIIKLVSVVDTNMNSLHNISRVGEGKSELYLMEQTHENKERKLLLDAKLKEVKALTK